MKYSNTIQIYLHIDLVSISLLLYIQLWRSFNVPSLLHQLCISYIQYVICGSSSLFSLCVHTPAVNMYKPGTLHYTILKSSPANMDQQRAINPASYIYVLPDRDWSQIAIHYRAVHIYECVHQTQSNWK